MPARNITSLESDENCSPGSCETVPLVTVSPVALEGGAVEVVVPLVTATLNPGTPPTLFVVPDPDPLPLNATLGTLIVLSVSVIVTPC